MLKLMTPASRFVLRRQSSVERQHAVLCCLNSFSREGSEKTSVQLLSCTPPLELLLLLQGGLLLLVVPMMVLWLEPNHNAVALCVAAAVV